VLGHTGVAVSILGLGGHALGKVSEYQKGVRLIRTAIDQGITFLDNAWCYHDGLSERMMGDALRDGYRNRVFLMTKNHGRDGVTFQQQLDQSLRRLSTDCVDLVQFHNIVHEADPDRILQEGALQTAMKARAQGKLRFIGFSGHHWPHLLMHMLEKGFEWDTVQLPVNLLDAHFRSFSKEVLPLLIERNIGVIGMKALAGRHLLKTGVSAKDAISYCLTKPVSTLVLGITSEAELEENLNTIRNWEPMPVIEENRLLEQTAPFAADGQFERYKTDPE
jgi:predicted aldo/keto reductase-like oxidoreductase